MPDQTPVQIAWVTRDLGTTEVALTNLLGAKKWVRMPDVHFGPHTCSYRGQPADFVAHVTERADTDVSELLTAWLDEAELPDLPAAS